MTSYRKAETPLAPPYCYRPAFRRPGEKEKFLFQTKSLLSHTYRSGFMPGIFQRALEEVDPNGAEDPSELAYAMASSAYAEMSEKIDLDWEVEFLDLAYEISQEAHEGVFRASGEPYFNHSLSVSKILLEDFPNPTTFKAIVGLLHDVIEDAEDPEEAERRILERFLGRISDKESGFVIQLGVEKAAKKLAFMEEFARMIVKAVKMLSKKKKGSYAQMWEHPLIAMESVMDQMSSLYSSFLLWSPVARPPKMWDLLLKHRADSEYHSRFDAVLENRLFIAVLYVKLADRYHNLLTPKPDKNDPSRPDEKELRKIVQETEEHYLDYAERLDARIYDLIKSEVDRHKAYLAKIDCGKRTKERVEWTLGSDRRSEKP